MILGDVVKTTNQCWAKDPTGKWILFTGLDTVCMERFVGERFEWPAVPIHPPKDDTLSIIFIWSSFSKVFRCPVFGLYIDIFKRIAYSLLATLLVPFVAWTAGFDFDHRGMVAAVISVYSGAVFMFVWSWTGRE